MKRIREIRDKRKGEKLIDKLDDNNREQVKPRPEPASEQHETWAFGAREGGVT
jgi:hypothetical protein